MSVLARAFSIVREFTRLLTLTATTALEATTSWVLLLSGVVLLLPNNVLVETNHFQRLLLDFMPETEWGILALVLGLGQTVANTPWKAWTPDDDLGRLSHLRQWCAFINALYFLTFAYLAWHTDPISFPQAPMFSVMTAASLLVFSTIYDHRHAKIEAAKTAKRIASGERKALV